LEILLLEVGEDTKVLEIDHANCPLYLLYSHAGTAFFSVLYHPYIGVKRPAL
jgi:hypothetical protein